jgi:hypothetical protein
VLRAALIAALAAAACTDDAAAPARRVAPPAVAAASAAADDDPGKRWDRATAALEARRAALADRYAHARGDAARAAVLADASAAFLDAVDELVAPWLGTPWGLGTNSTARRPHEPGMTVGCSYFVTSILQGAGVALDNRYHFAQAAALHIQRSLVGAGRAGIHRFLSVPPAELAPKLAALGDGLYLIGLSNHVGFVIVRGADVRFVHASYTNDRAVSDEPLASAAAIAASQPSGYFVSPLVTRAGTADDWLVDRWLRGATITFDPSR